MICTSDRLGSDVALALLACAPTFPASLDSLVCLSGADAGEGESRSRDGGGQVVCVRQSGNLNDLSVHSLFLLAFSFVCFAYGLSTSASSQVPVFLSLPPSLFLFLFPVSLSLSLAMLCL